MAKKKDDQYRLFDYGVDLDARIISLSSKIVSLSKESGVDPELADIVLSSVHLMSTTDPDGNKPINILLNNPGGDDYCMFAIYDALKGSKSKKIITVYGHAMSAASVILQAGDERIMSPHSRVMIHRGTFSASGHPKIVQQWAKESNKIENEVEQIYMERILQKNPNFKLRDLQKLLDFDTILNAKETIELGLADRILQ